MEHIPDGKQNTSSTLHKVRGWVFLLVCLELQLLLEGVLSSYGLFQNEWIKQFSDDMARSWMQGGEQQTASVVLSLLLGTGFLSYPISDFLVKQLGCLQVVVSGMGAVLATGSLLGAAQATSLQRLYLTAGVGTGIGLGLVYHSVQVSLYELITRESYLRPRVVLTMALCAKGLGTAVVAPLVDHLLLAHGDYRPVVICLAGLVLLCSAVYGWTYFKPKDQSEPVLFHRDSIVHLLQEEDKEDEDANNNNSLVPQTPKLSIRNIVVLLVFAWSSFFAICGYLVPYVFIEKLAEDRGMPGQGPVFLAVIGTADCFGRLLASCYLPRRPRNNAYCTLVVYSSCMIVCGIALFTVTSLSPIYVAGNFLQMAAYAAVFGFTGGCFLVLGHFCLADHLRGWPIRTDHALMYPSMMLQMAASLFGPIIAGSLVDRFVVADVAFHVAGSSLVVAGSILHLVPLLQRWRCRKAADTKREIDVLVLGSSRIFIEHNYFGQQRMHTSIQRTPCTV
ncbi:unnamed protein product [Trichogramma brassicae]|uniref:Major facilitator superfamily (MFS) profile domain-containing protein n=1 Tax=Trichogramma brassicae TaxID=86971 RepID=A0A6H5IKZ3_9HYME|nr:unnamed protein product [Trichogramma brassicae]